MIYPIFTVKWAGPLEPDDAGSGAFLPNMFVGNDHTWVFEEGLKAFF